MHTVALNNADTCITYALRRIGRADLIPTVDRSNFIAWLSGHFNVIPFTSDYVTYGDLLLWTENRLCAMPRVISADGKLYNVSAAVGLHIGVVENVGSFSHMTRKHEYDNPLTVIKVLPINEYSRKPDYICKVVK